MEIVYPRSSPRTSTNLAIQKLLLTKNKEKKMDTSIERQTDTERKITDTHGKKVSFPTWEREKRRRKKKSRSILVSNSPIHLEIWSSRSSRLQWQLNIVCFVLFVCLLLPPRRRRRRRRGRGGRRVANGDVLFCLFKRSPPPFAQVLQARHEWPTFSLLLLLLPAASLHPLHTNACNADRNVQFVSETSFPNNNSFAKPKPKQEKYTKTQIKPFSSRIHRHNTNSFFLRQKKRLENASLSLSFLFIIHSFWRFNSFFIHKQIWKTLQQKFNDKNRENY